MASSNCVILSEDVKPLMSQVAGHAHDKDKSTPGMLKHKDGNILKPLLKPAQAKTEIEFYEGLATSPHAALLPFVPKFYGTGSINLQSFKGEVLILEDVAANFAKPCIMDIKIGRQTWDPYALPSKRESEEKKYMECKRDLGFCIPGFQVYDPESWQLTKFDKKYGKSLNKKTVQNAFSTFLNLDKKKNAACVIQEYVSQLKRIFNIISQQISLHLYSSSILLTYDCAQLSSNVEPAMWAHVRMIDFAHTFSGESHETGPDKNYLNGLENLIQTLSDLKCS